MLILPGDEKRMRIELQPERLASFTGRGAKTMTAVNLLNAMDCRKLQSGLSRIGVELERSGANHRVRGEPAGCLQVPLQRRFLQELDVPDISKTFATDRIADEVLLKVQLHAGQVCNGVPVFGAGQSSQQAGSRI